MSKEDHDAIKAIKEQVAGITLEALAKRLTTKEYKVNKGYLSSVLRGHRPASSRLRIALGLHPLHVTVTPCARCGNVHMTKRCTAIKSMRKPDPVVRVARVDAARIAALSALYAQRGIGEARYRIDLKRELDGMTG